MWIVQIFIGTFWLVIGTVLLLREYMMWDSVNSMKWFRDRYRHAYSHEWKRFCRDSGILSFATGWLLIMRLPWGLNSFGVLSLILLFPIAYKWLRF